jgi:inosine-uridine nucleoside N-ribohydrolase
MRPFFIDTDTASDDAVALVMALRHPAVEVVGIGVVAGNVPLEPAVQNALYVAELCGADVPVHAGADRPLVLPLSTAQHVHGADGMGDIGLPLTGRSPTPGHAVDALLAASHRHAGALTLVTLGPLTNIAIAVRRDPTLAGRIGRCVVMGAVADHMGNHSPVAEFNMWVDPHAVAVVLQAELPLELVGWDISRRHAIVTPDEAASLRAIGTPLAEMCVDIQRVLTTFSLEETKLAGFDLPDPIAMAYAIDSTIATATRNLHCAVECDSPLTRGMVVMDVLGLSGRQPNALVVTEADRSRFLDMLRDALS